MSAKLDWLCADTTSAMPLDDPGVRLTEGVEFRVRRHVFASGLRLYETRARGHTHLRVRPQVPHREPFIAAHVTLSGSSDLRFEDGVSATTRGSHGSFFRPRGHESLFESEGPQPLHQVGVAADIPTLAQWFGGPLPGGLRPYLDDVARESRVAALAVPSVQAAAAAVLGLPRAGELRLMMLEGIALQMMAGFLDGLCGSGISEPGPTTRECNAAREARARLLDSLRAPPTAGELARAVGLPLRRLERLFRELFGGSVHAVLRRERLELAMLALRTEGTPIKTIAWRLGYDHVANFNRAFQARFGMAPSVARRGR